MGSGLLFLKVFFFFFFVLCFVIGSSVMGSCVTVSVEMKVCFC